MLVASLATLQVTSDGLEANAAEELPSFTATVRSQRLYLPWVEDRKGTGPARVGSERFGGAVRGSRGVQRGAGSREGGGCEAEAMSGAQAHVSTGSSPVHKTELVLLVNRRLVSCALLKRAIQTTYQQTSAAHKWFAVVVSGAPPPPFSTSCRRCRAAVWHAGSRRCMASLSCFAALAVCCSGPRAASVNKSTGGARGWEQLPVLAR